MELTRVIITWLCPVRVYINLAFTMHTGVILWPDHLLANIHQLSLGAFSLHPQPTKAAVNNHTRTVFLGLKNKFEIQQLT
jgi:hypothetical protein